MSRFGEPPARTSSTVATGAPFETWEALKRHLLSRSIALAEEVRRYPTPIARCDEQLTRLLEQRTRVLSQLKRVAGRDSEDPAHAGRPSLLSLQELVDSYDPSDDEIEMNIVARLRTALAESPGHL